MSRWIPLACFTVLLAGCLPVTVPLSDASKAEPDKRLVGAWEGMNSTHEEVDVPVVKGNPKGLMRRVFSKDEYTFWFFTTTIGKHNYMTVYLRPGNGPTFADFSKEGAYEKYIKGAEQRYFVFQYAVDGDKLVVDGGNRKVIEAVMTGARIEEADSSFKTPPGWLAKYLTENDPDAIFDRTNKQEYTRAKK
jgi:hypothetical protein